MRARSPSSDKHPRRGNTFSATYRGYAIGLLTASYGLNLFDRQIIRAFEAAIQIDADQTGEAFNFAA